MTQTRVVTEPGQPDWDWALENERMGSREEPGKVRRWTHRKKKWVKTKSMEASIRGRKRATGFGLGVGRRPDTPLLRLSLSSARAYPHQGVLQGCPCWSSPNSLLPCLRPRGQTPPASHPSPGPRLRPDTRRQADRKSNQSPATVAPGLPRPGVSPPGRDS